VRVFNPAGAMTLGNGTTANVSRPTRRACRGSIDRRRSRDRRLRGSNPDLPDGMTPFVTDHGFGTVLVQRQPAVRSRGRDAYSSKGSARASTAHRGNVRLVPSSRPDRDQALRREGSAVNVKQAAPRERRASTADCRSAHVERTPFARASAGLRLARVPCERVRAEPDSLCPALVRDRPLVAERAVSISTVAKPARRVAIRAIR